MTLTRIVFSLTAFTAVILLLPGSFAMAQSLDAGSWTQVFVRECGPAREGEVFPDCSSSAIQSELRVTDADLGITGNANSAYIQAQPPSLSAASAGYAGGGFAPAISAYSSSALGERIITSAVVFQRYEFLAAGELTGQLLLTYSQSGIDGSLPAFRSPVGFLRSGIVIFRTENDLFEPARCGVNDLTTGVALVTCLTAEAASQAPPNNNLPGEFYEGALDFFNFEFDDSSYQGSNSQSISFAYYAEAGDVIFVSADMFIFANNGGFGDSRTTLRIELDNPALVQASFPSETFVQAPRRVETDIKPSKAPNSINPVLGQKIPVAILTTEMFDATQIDWESVSFGPGNATEFHGRAHIEDVDDDGDMDLLLHFDVVDTAIDCGNDQAVLTGETFGGEPIIGTDSIVTVSCQQLD